MSAALRPRYSDGVQPAQRLNAFVNAAASEYPSSLAIVTMLVVEPASSSCANLSRAWADKSLKVNPNRSSVRWIVLNFYLSTLQENSNLPAQHERSFPSQSL